MRIAEAFLKSIENVTPDQWTFKASPTSWSIAEVAEHALVKDFNGARDKTTAWVKTTNEDLRAHEEVKTAAGYPK